LFFCFLSLFLLYFSLFFVSLMFFNSLFYSQHVEIKKKLKTQRTGVKEEVRTSKKNLFPLFLFCA